MKSYLDNQLLRKHIKNKNQNALLVKVEMKHMGDIENKLRKKGHMIKSKSKMSVFEKIQ